MGKLSLELAGVFYRTVKYWKMNNEIFDQAISFIHKIAMFLRQLRKFVSIGWLGVCRYVLLGMKNFWVWKGSIKLSDINHDMLFSRVFDLGKKGREN